MKCPRCGGYRRNFTSPFKSSPFQSRMEVPAETVGPATSLETPMTEHFLGPMRANPTRGLWCQTCQANTTQEATSDEKADYVCGDCGTPAYKKHCYECASYRGPQPQYKHWSGVFQCGIYGHPYNRDTFCAGTCGRWTHILSPGGRGQVYCGSCRPRKPLRRYYD